MLLSDYYGFCRSDHGFSLGEHAWWCKHRVEAVTALIPMGLRIPGTWAKLS